MKQRTVVAVVLAAMAVVAVAWAQTGTGSTVEEQTRGEPSWARLVSVVNWPTSQTVDGTVSVGNLPPVQDVSGSVEVTNLPAVQEVSGSVQVTNMPTFAGPPVFQFVGFSTAMFTGGEGVGTYALACQEDFSGSRMCFSKEIIETVLSMDTFSYALSGHHLLRTPRLRLG